LALQVPLVQLVQLVLQAQLDQSVQLDLLVPLAQLVPRVLQVLLDLQVRQVPLARKVFKEFKVQLGQLDLLVLLDRKE
jgi:hypothetical protein